MSASGDFEQFLVGFHKETDNFPLTSKKCGLPYGIWANAAAYVMSMRS